MCWSDSPTNSLAPFSRLTARKDKTNLESNHISLPANHSLLAIANFYSDPERAYKLLKSNMIMKTNVIKSGSYLKYIRDLRDKKVGTPEVESLAIKQYYGINV